MFFTSSRTRKFSAYRWIVHSSQLSPCLFDLRLRFRLCVLSLSKRSTDTGTQLFTALSVLTLVLSQPNKTPFSFPE